jgi:hypothetical protein
VESKKQEYKTKLTANDIFEVKEDIELIEELSQKISPIVGQESTYEGYEKLRDPFT